MNISDVLIQLTTEDVQNGLKQFLGERTLFTVEKIDENGIWGILSLKIPMIKKPFSVDFLASLSISEEHLLIEIRAHKIFSLPTPLVKIALQEIVKNVPFDMDILQQTLKIHIPTLLSLAGISLQLEDIITTPEGSISIHATNFSLSFLKKKMEEVLDDDETETESETDNEKENQL